jgi:hypothetical protein
LRNEIKIKIKIKIRIRIMKETLKLGRE